MTLPVVFTANGPSGYNLTKSLRFRSSATANLQRTPATTTSQTTWTWSGWVKRGKLGSVQYLFGTYPASGQSNSTWIEFGFYANDILAVGGWTTSYRQTTQVFRDPSAWYHIVLAIDSTQATASNRVKLYVNGSEITAFTTNNNPSSSQIMGGVNSTVVHCIGNSYPLAGTNPFDGYLAEVNFIDGQALTPSSFGSTNALTGVWQPAKYTGTYGTNGFYLPFTNTTSTTTLGYDFSGNSNNWTTNNLSLTAGTTYDSMTDVPTLTSATVANYAVLNPLNKGSGTVIDGNLQNNGSGWSSSMTTISFAATGNYYCEMTGISVAGASQGVSIGILNPEYNLIGYADAIGNQPQGYGWYSYGGKTYFNGTGTTYNGGVTYTTNDILGIQLNNGTLTFYKNGTSQGTAYTGITGNYCFAVSCYGTDKIALNCGQRPFSYTPPTGSVALNTYNLPTSTIIKGNTVMDATTYTGTLLSNAVTNTAGFKPDLVWIKSRSAATDNKLTDSVRGTTKGLISNTTGAETTDIQGLTAFGTGGFTVGTNTDYNNLAATYVGWQWQAGQGTTSSNTSGSITSTISVNASAGFSIVTYTGTGSNATVGHGLGVAPSMVIVKSRSDASTYWCVYQSAIWATSGTDYTLLLPLTNGAASRPTLFNSTQPSSTVFSIGTNGGVNNSGSTYVAYCWSEIAGFSKFGSYTGNGSTDGPFVYTGFRPKFVLLKVSSGTTANWVIIDSARNTYNVMNSQLNPDASDAEYSGSNIIDTLSNGFKLRNTPSTFNGSGNTYIYACFAENPFKNALAR